MLPAEQFAGYSAYVVGVDGSLQKITFRVEPVGDAGLGPGSFMAGWVVPFGEGVGVVTTVFSDAPPRGRGPYLDVVDERVFGGANYSVRQTLFAGMENLNLRFNSSFTFYVYIHPFNDERELERACQQQLWSR